MARLHRSSIVSATLIVAIGFAVCGCDEPPQIRQYRVAKSRSDLGSIGVEQNEAAASNSAASTDRESRMVVAVATREDATWFFKITGSKSAVAGTADQWKTILTGMKFDSSGNPQWQLPENWTQGPMRQMRFATLLTATENGESVEMSISNLGPDQDLPDNVNRWRNQLSLPAISPDEVNLKKMESASGTLLIFDESGSLSGRPMSMSPPQPALRQPDELKLKYVVPNGWTEGSQNSIVKVRLLHGEGEKAPQITVTQLLGTANEWVPNAQRWANQVGMEMDATAMEKLTSDATVGGIAGKKIRLIPDGESPEVGIIAVMLDRGELAWFFKMVGDPTFIVNNENDFDEFLKSFQFEE